MSSTGVLLQGGRCVGFICLYTPNLFLGYDGSTASRGQVSHGANNEIGRIAGMAFRVPLVRTFPVEQCSQA